MFNIHVQKDKDRAIVTLVGELTVHNAKEMRAALLDATSNFSAIEIVLEAVERLDSSFPQLLCSAHRTAAAVNKTLTLAGADNDRFADMLRRSGFIRQTGCRDSSRTSCFWQHGQASK